MKKINFLIAMILSFTLIGIGCSDTPNEEEPDGANV